jgi:hypothetical protein
MYTDPSGENWFGSVFGAINQASIWLGNEDDRFSNWLSQHHISVDAEYTADMNFGGTGPAQIPSDDGSGDSYSSTVINGAYTQGNTASPSSTLPPPPPINIQVGSGLNGGGGGSSITGSSGGGVTFSGFAGGGSSELSFSSVVAPAPIAEPVSTGYQNLDGVLWYNGHVVGETPLESDNSEYLLLGGAQLIEAGVSGLVSLLGKEVVEEATEGVAVQFTKSNLKLGQQMHKAYHLGEYGKEFRLPSGRRIDFLDLNKGIINELKPNNPRAIQAGEKQLQMYLQEIRTMPRFQNTIWKTNLDLY